MSNLMTLSGHDESLRCPRCALEIFFSRVLLDISTFRTRLTPVPLVPGYLLIHNLVALAYGPLVGGITLITLFALGPAWD